jgi:Protein of unknown function (DUF2799)
MRSVLLAAGAMLLIGGCASMNEDQCRAGDWGSQGYRDGLRGFPVTRLDAHAKACGKYGIVPEPAPYQSAREDGLRGYCRLERGFDAGRRGESYHGVCRPEEEFAFLPAYRDGLRLHAAEAALETARSDLDRAVSWIRDREDKLDAKQRELGEQGKTDAEKEQIRSRIREVRGELQEARRRAREVERALSWAEDEADRVRFDLAGRYPV